MAKKLIETLRKQAIKDCITYHGDEIKFYSPKSEKITKNNVIDIIEDFSFDGYEDIAYFVGYFRALEDMEK